MKKSILVQLDTDPVASLFDRVVGVDAGVDFLFSHAGVTPGDVKDLVHGAIFTRGAADLKSTAFFIGGSDIVAGEDLYAAVQKVFFADRRVSVMLDSNGSNTTAAAAVLCASRHLYLKNTRALVIGGTGPVGMRVSQLLAREGAEVNLGSRDFKKAEACAINIRDRMSEANVKPFCLCDEGIVEMFHDVELVVAAGAAGVQVISKAQWENPGRLKVAIDLNAVPPVGIEGISVMDDAKEINGVTCFGAIGVGGLKMKIHKAAIQAMFESNDQLFDAMSLYDFGKRFL
ncbi:NADP-dependent methylenetetrahydromethanopterin/methylenetetrahydrofolate dehydrogenase [Lacunimicrobium album]